MPAKVEDIEPMLSELESRAALRKIETDAEDTDEDVLDVCGPSELTLEEESFWPL